MALIWFDIMTMEEQLVDAEELLCECEPLRCEGVTERLASSMLEVVEASSPDVGSVALI